MIPRRSRNSKDPNQREILRAQLRAARIRAGLRQIDLANRLGTPQSYVSKYETGERVIDVLELISICRALELPLLDFFQELESRFDHLYEG